MLQHAKNNENCIAGKECNVSCAKHTNDTFQLSSSGGDSVIVSFEERLVHDLPSELLFSQSVLKKTDKQVQSTTVLLEM